MLAESHAIGQYQTVHESCRCGTTRRAEVWCRLRRSAASGAMRCRALAQRGSGIACCRRFSFSSPNIVSAIGCVFFGIHINCSFVAGSRGIEQFSQERNAPAAACSGPPAFTDFTGNTRFVDANEVHNFSLTDMKTVAEFVVGLHDRLQFRNWTSESSVTRTAENRQDSTRKCKENAKANCKSVFPCGVAPCFDSVCTACVGGGVCRFSGLRRNSGHDHRDGRWWHS